MPVPDRAVRARTRAGRLAALDAWVVRDEQKPLAPALSPWGEGAMAIDVGFGDSATTTLELARAVRAVNPDLRIVGVDRDASRVASAQTSVEPGVSFVAGGFAELAALGPACLVRAVNVLRAYREDEVPAIHELLGAPLIEGGLVVEGSSDVDGAVTVVHLLRKTAGALVREALLFHTDFSRGFAPWLFRDWLPRDLRRRVRPGEPMHGFLSVWSAAFEATRTRDPAEDFVASATRLATQLEGVSTDAWCLEHGYLRWAPTPLNR